MILTATIMYGQSDPCQKKIIQPYDKNMHSIVIYPNCNDTTVFLVRVYKDNELRREEWYKNNKLNGLNKFFNSTNSSTMVTTEILWDTGNIIQTNTYFQNSSIISTTRKATSDSTDFSITYYQNGNIKEYGNLKTLFSCPYGQWTEMDSLGIYKWTGFYKIVNMEKRDSSFDNYGNEVFFSVFTCSQKDGIWKKTDKDHKIIDQQVYIDGKLKK
jgi:antitoxin component YwqK of YwqJK toxin-antitoxin module